jgi:23S rRNA (uracil1939-C5)-methyltransferase
MTVTITRLGHRGDGVAEGPEGAVFVTGALPGEVVEGAVVSGRIATPRILVPSPDRVTPPCRHARTCGGCLLQHASDGFVSRWKVEQVSRALALHGIAAPIRGIHVSPPGSRRRATLAARRTRSGVTLGFHRKASGEVIAVPECRLLHPGLMAAFPALSALAALGASRKGEMALAVTLTTTGLDVAVTGGKPADAALQGELARLAEAHGLARLTWDGELVALRVQPLVRFGLASVPIPPGAFLQATAEGESALLDAVRAAAGPARRIVDLFAGCGTFALPLAETAEVHAADSDPAAIAALQEGWRRTPDLRALSAEARDLFRRPFDADELRGFDVAVMDPPRAGAAAQTAALAAARVPVIVAVSRNPATFARDAETLVAAGYRLDWVTVVDQFRWSAHVELAARFALPHIAGGPAMGIS